MTDTIALIEQAHKGDKKAREALVEENLGLVHHIVKRFQGRGYDSEDLFQIGSIGLMKAIDHFDTSFEVRFSTYAVPMIAGEVKRFLRDDGMVKVSRTLKENAYKVAMATNELLQRYGRTPTFEEVLKETGLRDEDAVLAMEASSEVESIYKTVYQSDGNDILLVDTIMDEGDRKHEEILNQMLLKQLLAELPEKERELIVLRYFREKTQMEVARILGITQVQVSRLEKKILERMRQKCQNGKFR